MYQQQPDDLGHEMVAAVRKKLKVDDEWSHSDADGFTWWPKDYAQRIWTEPGLFQHANITYRLHAETDVVRERGEHGPTEAELIREMSEGSLSALIFEPESRTFRLHCSVYAADDNREWLCNVFDAAAALQVVEAQAMMEASKEFNTVPATSGHPQMGIRSDSSELIAHTLEFFKPAGDRESRWVKSSEWQEANWALERESSTFETDHKTWARGSFPFRAIPDSEQVLSILTEAEDPMLGHGLTLSLQLPLKLSDVNIARMALELNQLERENWMRCHLVGGWCNVGGKLTFRIFVPNVICKEGQLKGFTVNQSTRAIWVDEVFLQKRQEAEATKFNGG
jgi:hypothetical protein